MNILLWVLQILLALWNLIGGIYTISNYDQLKSTWATNLPKPVWLVISALQIFFALCLVVPGLTGVLPKLPPIAATYLAINALLGCALFAKYAGFPGLLWGIIPAVLAAFVAYGRF
jgi:hypothetical protein